MARFRALSQVPAIRRFVSGACVGLLFLGCDGVQEDRRIEFTANGGQVAFQHGSDGIFVADPQSGELHKVFDPDPTVIAVSTPNWSDDETRAIFTDGPRRHAPMRPIPPHQPNRALPQLTTPRQRTWTPTNWEDAPTGRLFLAQPIVYTCWLVERGQAAAIAKPVSFRRAVRTRRLRRGQSGRSLGREAEARVLHRAGRAAHSCGLDLRHGGQTQDAPFSRRPPDGGDHVVFDLLGDSRHVVCVASGSNATSAGIGAAEPDHGERSTVPPNGSKPPSSVSGIWLGSIEGSDWWHVPESRTSEQGKAPKGFRRSSRIGPCAAGMAASSRSWATKKW